MTDLPVHPDSDPDKPEPPPSRLGGDAGPATEGERHSDGAYEPGSGAASNDPGIVVQDASGIEEEVEEGHADVGEAGDEPRQDDSSSDDGPDGDEPDAEFDGPDDATNEAMDSDEPGSSDGESTDDGAAHDEPDVGSVVEGDTEETESPTDDHGDDFDAAAAR